MATVEQLALTGGRPVVPFDRHREWPDVRPEDREAVLAVLDRGLFCGANAPEITALQDEWAEYLGVKHCLALNSGTAALHCCLAAAGVRAGDEVIVPAYTFSATAMAVAHQGAVPVFVDVHRRTYNLDPEKIEEKLTERTRAILAVHLHGLPADMDEIHAVANRHGLAVIEDAAQSHGALYRGRKTGTLAPCAAFSINATKNLSGGEGGFFVTDDDTAHVTEDRTSVYHKFRVRLDPAAVGFDGQATELRDRVINALRAEGVEAGLWQIFPLPAYPAFRRPLRPWHPEWDDEPLDPFDPADFPETSRLLDESLILGSEPRPLFVQDGELMQSYVEAFEKVLGSLDALLELPFEPVRLRY